MTVLNETIHTGAYVVSEANGRRAREVIFINNAAELLSGTVLKKTGVPAGETVSAAAAAGNTGNGTIAMDGTAPLDASAVDGVYQIEMLTATTFNVLSPLGVILGRGSTGSAYTSGHVKFTVTAGGTPMVAGDRFLITVLRPDGAADLYAPVDANSQAAAILYTHVRASATPTNVRATAHVRATEVRLSDLTWPAGFTNAQIAEGIVQLKALGIIPR